MREAEAVQAKPKGRLGNLKFISKHPDYRERRGEMHMDMNGRSFRYSIVVTN